MSAIAGVAYTDSKKADRSCLDRMMRVMAHRGPDGRNVWTQASVSLGHCMMQTTPQSLYENLPFWSYSHSLAITADARLDNRPDLIDKLGAADTANLTDSSLILAAYVRWGVDCPKELLGDFVFAIWDSRRHLLFCARDHFGVKPFYYTLSKGAFVFASEIKAVRSMPGVPNIINESRVADYLGAMINDTHSTLYKGIFRLPPAHSLSLIKGKVHCERYWRLDPTRELVLNSDEEYAEKFKEVFTTAVRCRLSTRFPIGTNLSGGLDSSSISCTASNLLCQNNTGPIHTFSAVFDDVPECDERQYIDTVIAQGGFIPHYIRADLLSPLTDWNSVISYQDEALYAGNLYMHWHLLRAAQEHGVRILLDGVDGDTVVSHGTSFLNELAVQGQWSDFALEAKGLSTNFGGSSSWILREYGSPHLRKMVYNGNWISLSKQIKSVAKHFDTVPRDILCNHIIRPLVGDLTKRLRSFEISHKDDSRLKDFDFVDRNFADRINMVDRLKIGQPPPLSSYSEREDHYNALNNEIHPFVFEIADRASAAFGIETRYPFFDKRLVELCLSLPPRQKIRNGLTRIILRHAMNGVIPIEVQWREGKQNLSANFIRGFLIQDRGIIDDVIHRGMGGIEKYINMKSLRLLYEDCTSNHSSPRVDLLWQIVTLAIWLEYAKIDT